MKNKVIELMRYISSLLVVAIHLKPIENIYLNSFYESAIYFFLMVSSYYFCKYLYECKETNNIYIYIYKRVVSIIKPLLFWQIIYFLINFYNEILINKQSILLFLRSNIVSLFIYKTSEHLWFMAALIVYMFILYILFKYKKEKALLFTCPLLFAIGLLGSRYYFIGENIIFLKDFINTNIYAIISRIFFMGLPIYALGLLAYKSRNIRAKKSIIVIMLIISILETYLIEKFYGFSSYLSSLFLPIFVYFLTKYLLNTNFMIDHDAFYRLASTVTYYTHPLIRIVLASLFGRIFNVVLSNITMYLLTIILCFILSLIVYKINNKFLNIIFR